MLLNLAEYRLILANSAWSATSYLVNPPYPKLEGMKNGK